MKRFLNIFLLSPLLLLSACQSTNNTKAIDTNANSIAQNKAYLSPCLKQVTNTSQKIKRGYGSGQTLNQAKQHAYKDIAEQLGVKVKTTSQTLVIKNQTAVTQNYQNKIDTFAQAELSDLSIECLDKQDPTGKIHIILGFDLRPLYARIADTLINATGYAPGKVQLIGPTFLTNSKLAEDVKNALLARGGTKALNAKIKLRRYKDQWQWIIAGQPFFLENKQLHLAINWKQLNNGLVEISAISPKMNTLAPIVKTETEFRLLIMPNHSGYLHILGIYENGEINVIRSDIKTKALQKHLFPENGGVFEAGLIEQDKTATDVYFAIITSKTLAKSNLLSPKGLSKNNAFYLTAFLSSLQKSNHATNHYLLTISP